MSDAVLPTGTRVVLTRDVDRYPFFLAEAGMRGVVTTAQPGNVWVRLDRPLRGAEDWDNEIQWDESSVTDFANDVRIAEAVRELDL